MIFEIDNYKKIIYTHSLFEEKRRHRIALWYVIQVQALHELAVIEKMSKDVLLPGESAFVMRAERMVKKYGEWQKVVEVAFQKYGYHSRHSRSTKSPAGFREALVFMGLLIRPRS